MNRTKIKYQIPSLVLLFATAFLFQNCSGRLMSEGELVTSEFASVDPQKLFEGQKLYGQHCALCHGDINTSAKRGRSAGSIRSAISAVTNMKSINLTDDQLSLIALALKSNFSGSQMCANPTDVGRVTVHRLNKREFNNSVRDLFGFGGGHRVEAERMNATVGSADSNGWGLWDNGSLSQTLRLADGQAYNVIVRAKATLYQGVGAQMKLRYANADVQTQMVSATAYTNYTFSISGRDSANLEIHFINNQVGGGEDRNLIVDYVQVVPINSVSINFAQALPDDNSGETFDNDAMSLFSDISYTKKLIDVSYQVVNEALMGRRSAIFAACTGETDACARTIIRSLAYTAYRRPVPTANENSIFNIYKLARTEGDSYIEGMRQAMVAILVSPQFMFRAVEHPDNNNPAIAANLDSYDVASRLSYFIWGSIPDGALQLAAQNNQLQNASDISAQVRRMMADPRSINVVEALTDQWLEMKKLKSKAIDTALFPAFSEALRKDMDTETRMLVAKIFREDLPLSTLLSSNTTFMNSRLAAHYGVSGFTGNATTFKETSVGSLRQGILGHASVLTLTSHADETSIVHRGKFVLKNMLCDMPPPPPAGVIDPPGSEQDKSNLRLTNPTCVACHSQMDPIGQGLQNFNTIGAYRTVDELGASIPAGGTLPNGVSFSGLPQLSNVIANDDRAKVCATGKIMNLALGRKLNATDDCVVNRIAIQEDAFRQPISKLVEAIALSDEFRKQRGEAP